MSKDATRRIVESHDFQTILNSLHRGRSHGRSNALLSKLPREAHPIRAAERQQIVAPGASPGFSPLADVSAGGAADSRDSFAPTGLSLKTTPTPGSRPGLQYAAAPRLNKGVPPLSTISNAGASSSRPSVRTEPTSRQALQPTRPDTRWTITRPLPKICEA